MKTIKDLTRIAAAYFVIASMLFTANAQTAGGGEAGLGKVIAAAGLAAGTVSVQNSAKNKIKNLFTKEAIARKWKAPATGTRTVTPKTRKVVVTKKNPKTGKVTKTTVVRREPDPEPDEDYDEEDAAPLNLAAFEPDPYTDNMRIIANAFGKTDQQKGELYTAFASVKQSFETELQKYGAKNNVAGGMLVFLVVNSGIYHDTFGNTTNEKKQEELELALFKVMNKTLDTTPGMANVSNRDKQALYDMYIGLSALTLSTYVYAKQTNDVNLKKTSQLLAGEFLKQMMSVNPDDIDLSKY